MINQGFSYLVLGGPPGKTYFFLVEKLPKKIFAGETPRYTDEDAKAFVDKHRNDVIIEGCTFGDVFDNHTSFGMTPLHEHAFDQWHYGRIITLGDAAHKVRHKSRRRLGLGLAVLNKKKKKKKAGSIDADVMRKI